MGKGRALLGLLCLALVASGVVVGSGLLGQSPPNNVSGVPSVPVPPLTAKGTIVAKAVTKLGFTTPGRLSEVRYEIGAVVTEGAVLARLATDDVELGVRAANDALAIQQALLDQLLAGTRTEDIAAAQAAYEGAVARMDDLLSGATDADFKAAELGVATAETDLARAQSALAKLLSGIDPNTIRLAEQAVERAKSSLWATQVERDGLKGNAANPTFVGAAADARVMAAEVAVAEAQTKLEQARQSTTKPEEVAAAERAVASADASLTSAEAKLKSLQSGAGTAEIATARAAVTSAKAQLDLKRNGPAPADIAVARARLRQAETQLAVAKHALASAELRAPFSGTVIALGARAGEYVGPGTMVLTLADLTSLRVETNDLDEHAVKGAVVGKEVVVDINALSDKRVTGVVRSTAPTGAANASGDTTFTAVIDLASVSPELRPGMTVKVQFGERSP